MDIWTLYLLAKTLHVVGFVSWFAGMFFLVRLFVNHAEAAEKSEPERSILIENYRGMEDRVYRIIMNPAVFLTFTFGWLMVGLSHKIGQNWLFHGWFQVKLVLLTGLVGYHLWCRKLLREMASGIIRFDSFQFRLFNEVPTLFLVAIVLLGIFQGNLRPVPTILGLGVFASSLFFGAKKYRDRRAKK